MIGRLVRAARQARVVTLNLVCSCVSFLASLLTAHGAAGQARERSNWKDKESGPKRDRQSSWTGELEIQMTASTSEPVASVHCAQAIAGRPSKRARVSLRSRLANVGQQQGGQVSDYACGVPPPPPPPPPSLPFLACPLLLLTPIPRELGAVPAAALFGRLGPTRRNEPPVWRTQTGA